jgi:hypothetical protein
VVLGGGELGHGGDRHDGDDQSLRQRRHSRASHVEEALVAAEELASEMLAVAGATTTTPSTNATAKW